MLIFSGNEDIFVTAFFMQNCNFDDKFVSETGLKMLILSAGINVNIKMYIFDHLRMYKFAYSSSCVMYSLNR